MRLTYRLIDQFEPAMAATMVETLLQLAAQMVVMIGRGEDMRRPVQVDHPDRLDAIKAYIDRHLDDPKLDVDRLAFGLGLSRSELYRAFSVKGGGVARFILNRRLDLCHEALLSGMPTRPIRDIAARWGLNDYGVFLRAFRRRFGTSPSTLRAKLSQAAAQPEV